MNYMADLIRDCSKARPTTFNQISFPIFQDIEHKIKNKNLGLRKKAKSKINDRLKLSKQDEIKEDNSSQPKKETILYNKIEREKQQFNYMELYRDQRQPRVNLNSSFPLQLDKLDDKDEEITFQIYLMIKKKKSIFKVEEVKRKLRSKEGGRRMNMRECQCCGTIGKHKCKHIICLKKCEKYVRKQQKEVYYENVEPNHLVVLAQEMIQDGSVKGPKMQMIEIIEKKQKEETVVMPQIDRIEEDQEKEEIEQERQQLFEQSNEESQMVRPRQSQRISQNQPNSLVSEGKNKPELNELAIVPNNVEEKQQQIQEQILVSNPQDEEVKGQFYQQ